MEEKYPKSIKIAELITKELLDGIYGESGEHFFSVRELAKAKNISLVTSKKTIDILHKENLLFLYNRSYYITTGRILKDSKLYKAIEKRTKNVSGMPLIGIHFPKVNNEFFSTLLKKVMSFIRKEGYMPIVMFSENSLELEQEILQSFVKIGVKGVITCPNEDMLQKNFYDLYPLPVVYLAQRSMFYDENYVVVDDNASASHVAKHLVDMGYENFMYIGFERMGDNDYRLNSFRNELKKRGKTIPPENIILIKENDKLFIPSYVLNIISKAKKPLGIFCFHDLIAIDLLNACKNQKFNIPEDVGVVGFDNLDIAMKYSPTLSTVAYNFDNMASTAVKMLVEIIKADGRLVKQPVLVGHIMYQRESTHKKI